MSCDPFLIGLSKKIDGQRFKILSYDFKHEKYIVTNVRTQKKYLCSLESVKQFGEI